MGLSRKSRRATLHHRRLELEALESRDLMTASPGHSISRQLHAGIAHLHSRPSPTDATLASDSASPGDIIGAAATRSTYGVDGTGMTVAVIDTGVNYRHEALGGGFGGGHKVVAGYDFTEADGDPFATDQHGTAVAGLIASRDPAHPGVAPGADLAALRVFGNDQDGSFDYVAKALQWVIDNHAKYNITAVNLSMADGNNYAQNWFAQDGGIGQKVTDLVGRLDALNIPVIAATGNSFGGQQGVGFPAIIADTISVTSTDSGGGQLSSNAQRLGTASGGDSATDLAAPAEGLIAPVQDDQFSAVEGTSFAAPEVTGAVVLLQQIYQSRFGTLPSVGSLESWLKQGADPVSDPLTQDAIGRLDIPKAASLIPNPRAQLITQATTPPATIADPVVISVAPAESELITGPAAQTRPAESPAPTPSQPGPSVTPVDPPASQETSGNGNGTTAPTTSQGGSVSDGPAKSTGPIASVITWFSTTARVVSGTVKGNTSGINWGNRSWLGLIDTAGKSSQTGPGRGRPSGLLRSLRMARRP
jgi:subtilisin family serine protease